MTYRSRPLASFAILVLAVACCLWPSTGCARRAASSESAGGEARTSKHEAKPDAVPKRPADRPEPRRDAGDAAPDLRAVEESIVGRTNELRRAEGRGPVTADGTLAKAAQYFADFMARTGEYGHTADGKEPAERAAAHGYDYCIVLENIAYQYSSAGFETAELADGFVEGWKDSPGHRKNMLDADVTQTAAAVAQSAKTDYYYAVQLFGRPKSAAIVFELANESGREVRYAIDDELFTLPPRYTRTHTRCRPPTMRIDGEGESLKPGNGDRYVLRAGRSGAGLEVTKQ